MIERLMILDAVLADKNYTYGSDTGRRTPGET
jgi:hypothetical protein